VNTLSNAVQKSKIDASTWFLKNGYPGEETAFSEAAFHGKHRI
jgi:hypothetical protein